MGNMHFWFNETTHECEFICPAIGEFEHPLNCQKYYHCNEIQQKGDLRECDPGKYFDNGACINGHCSRDY